MNSSSTAFILTVLFHPLLPERALMDFDILALFPMSVVIRKVRTIPSPCTRTPRHS